MKKTEKSTKKRKYVHSKTVLRHHRGDDVNQKDDNRSTIDYFKRHAGEGSKELTMWMNKFNNEYNGSTKFDKNSLHDVKDQKECYERSYVRNDYGLKKEDGFGVSSTTYVDEQGKAAVMDFDSHYLTNYELSNNYNDMMSTISEMVDNDFPEHEINEFEMNSTALIISLNGKPEFNRQEKTYNKGLK